MPSALDTAFTLCAATVVAGLSVTGFARTDPGNPTTGWTDGTFQRGYETRFERSLPAHEPSVAFWSAIRWGVFREPAAGAVAGREGWLFSAEEFSRPKDSRSFLAELYRAADHLQGKGIRLVPVIVPDKARMQASHLARGRSSSFETRYDHALRVIAEAGFPVIDLRTALEFDTSYMRTDTHWSPEGARAAAEAIAKQLVAYEFPRATVETRLTGARELEGDLLSFVATGALRPYIGPALDTIPVYETQVGNTGGLLGDVPVPVALVGTSFSAKPAFHFEGFLKQALQADVLNASQIGQGPFAPMNKFLSDIEHFASPPSLVIWEIPERYLKLNE
ncbi:MAG: hypothetical protein AAF718_05495 [Pseudomonadota bacterium]